MPRVLIVDDSPTARELIAAILDNGSDIEVVGHAVDGIEAVQMTHELRPDVVTMDIHMPRLNGLEATQAIMWKCPTPIVIVSASTLVNDVEWALQALQAGALTLLLKPPGPGAPRHEAAAKELVETVNAMAGVKVVRRRSRAAADKKIEQPPPATVEGTRAISIAASTGGPPAILEVLKCLPSDFAVPILIVQHIAEGFTEGFASWLDAAISLRAKVAEQNEPLTGGVIYVAPEDRHLGMTRNGRVLLSDDDPIGGFRPSADYLFESVGRVCKQHSIGVILTGMGSDGVAGLEVLRSGGGQVIAQNEDSCVVYGMPGAANRAGVVDSTLALDKIGPAILRDL